MVVLHSTTPQSSQEATKSSMKQTHAPVKTTRSTESKYETRAPQTQSFKPGQRILPSTVPNTYTQQVRKPRRSTGDYEPVSVYENVCALTEHKGKKTGSPKSEPRGVGSSRAREAERLRQTTHEVVVLPTDLSPKSWEESDDYTPLKTIRHTPGTYEQTWLHHEQDSDSDEYEDVQVYCQKR